MARRWKFALGLVFLVQSAHCVIYGPSLEFLTNRRGQGGEYVDQRVIKLNDYAPTYSVVVPLAVNTTTAEPYNVRPTGEFIVEAPENMRVMAVIQSLHLRTKSVTSAFPPVCRDYIVFNDESMNKICGDLSSIDKKTFRMGGMMGNRTYLSASNKLSVAIYIDSSTFVEEWMKSPITVEISFTAYRTCWPSSSAHELFNCMDQLIPYQQSCISSELICDGVVNCGIQTDSIFSKDEMNCNTTLPLSADSKVTAPSTSAPPAGGTTSPPPPISAKNPVTVYAIRSGGGGAHPEGILPSGTDFAIRRGDYSISFNDRHLWINNNKQQFRDGGPAEHHEFWPFEKIVPVGSTNAAEPSNLHGAIVFTIVGLMVVVVIFQILYHVVRSIHRSIQSVRSASASVSLPSTLRIRPQNAGSVVDMARVHHSVESEARITITSEQGRNSVLHQVVHVVKPEDEPPPAYELLFPSSTPTTTLTDVVAVPKP